MHHYIEEAEMGSETDHQFLTRVGSLPVVTSALNQLWMVYGNTKEYNRLVKYTLEIAEYGVKVATNTAMPMINQLKKPSEYMFMMSYWKTCTAVCIYIIILFHFPLQQNWTTIVIFPLRCGNKANFFNSATLYC